MGAIRGGAKKLTQTETALKQQLPTAVDIKEEREGTAEEQAAAALAAGKEKLKTSETHEHSRLPTSEDIKAEQIATETAERVLAESKANLRHAETRETDVVATEKPDATAIRGGAKKLTHTETALKQNLPTADDIKEEREGTAEEQAAAALAAGKDHLKPVSTSVHQRLPSVDDIKAEKDATEKAASILAEGKANLKHAETRESDVVATEKPDLSAIRGGAKRLTPTETT